MDESTFPKGHDRMKAIFEKANFYSLFLVGAFRRKTQTIVVTFF